MPRRAGSESPLRAGQLCLERRLKINRGPVPPGERPDVGLMHRLMIAPGLRAARLLRLSARHLGLQFLEPVLDEVEPPRRALFVADAHHEEALAVR